MSSRNVDGERLGEPLGAKHRADISPLPQPSDATELVEEDIVDFIRDQVCCPRIHGCELGGAEECPAERVRAALTQAQARATAAEEREVMFAGGCGSLTARLQAAQQTITQLTRELETARKVLEPLVNTPLPKARQFDDPIEVLELWAACRIEIRKALSSLSHQDEQG